MPRFKNILRFSVLAYLLVAGPKTYAESTCRFLFESPKLFHELSPSEQIERQMRAMQPDSPSSVKPEKRLKYLTDGDPAKLNNKTNPSTPLIDNSDPSAPLTYIWPDGTKEVRISLSDGLFLSRPDLSSFEKGVIGEVSRERAFNDNGIEMTGSAAGALYPWDTELLMLPDGKVIGYGGAVQTSSATDFPTDDENPRRSRMYAQIVREKLSDGSIDERWYYKKSILHDDRPINDDWIQPYHHHHSYGGSYLRDQNGTPVKNSKGNFIYFFDMVDRQKNNLPWRTSVYVSEMDPSGYFLVGPKHLVNDGINPKTRKPYPATMRSFGGSLLEGFRPLLQATYVSPGFVRDVSGKVIALDDAELTGMASPGDYTERYGIAMLYKPSGQSILGKYQMVETDDSQDIHDFANFYREIFGLTWVGRASPYFNAELGEWRMLFHAVPVLQQPPPGGKERYRQVLWSPIRLERNTKGQLIIAPDLTDQEY